MKNYDVVIAVEGKNRIFIYDFIDQGEAEKEAHDRAEMSYWNEYLDCMQHMFDYPEQKQYWSDRADEAEYNAEHISIMSYDNFAVREREILLAGEPEEVTEETFEEQLDVLPPLAWCSIGGVEMFCMAEMYTGSYTTQYAHDKISNKYYCKMVDVSDRKTWINTFLRA